jgi:hypothetical protein
MAISFCNVFHFEIHSSTGIFNIINCKNQAITIEIPVFIEKAGISTIFFWGLRITQRQPSPEPRHG